jgi:hypothetical protein
MNADYDYSLRGRCHEMASQAVDADPTLSLVRGWYHDPDWGTQEHWWAAKPDGTIVDPTAAQFPFGGVSEWYEPFSGVFECEECGRDVAEADAVAAGVFVVCSTRCFARLVGM